MPTITLNGQKIEFKAGEVILQAANRAAIEVPQYCYHDGLSIVASCRICLAEVWMPNPKNNNALEPYMGGKLMPTCQTAAIDGMVVYTDSPKAVANQKAVMEYLLINHPLDCPVCDQSGECFLQDYSYQYGRGKSRFEEVKVKNPKKDVGPNVYLYADRCIMCTRCVRFTREVAGTGELMVQGRGNKEEIDVFPGMALDNELSVNVVDLCPVGALLEKDFLFSQRVWFLKEAPSIDGLTASGDNISVHHNEGKVYRIKPRTNMAVNKWWISDEIRYSYKHVHSEKRLTTPMRRQFGVKIESDWARALNDAADAMRKIVAGGKRVALIASPMLSAEDAFALADAAVSLDERAVLALGPVPMSGQDKTFPANDPNGYRIYAEKAPNARGVKRVLSAYAKRQRASVLSAAEITDRLSRSGDIGAVIVTGNYPSDWATPELLKALDGKYLVVIDTLESSLSAKADIVLPGATWVEKAGTFENARVGADGVGMLQVFEQAIPVINGAKSEGQIGVELALTAAVGPAATIAPGSPGPIDDGTQMAAGSLGMSEEAPDGSGTRMNLFNAAECRRQMAERFPEDLGVFVTRIEMPAPRVEMEPDMEMVEL